jgi:serine/threonine protein kinase
MLTGLPPFYTRDRDRLFNNIQYGEVDYKDYLSQRVKDLLSSLFIKDPELRLGSGPNGAQDIKNHPWFQEINWDSLLRKQVPPPFVPNSANGNPIHFFEPEFTRQPAVDSAGREEAKLAGSPTYNGFSYKESNALDSMVLDTSSDN